MYKELFGIDLITTSDDEEDDIQSKAIKLKALIQKN
jgi:hypothetical protein